MLAQGCATMSKSPDDRRFAEKFFGRRAGQSLRNNQARLIEDMLPKLRVPDHAGALNDPQALFADTVCEVWLEIGFGGGEHLAWQATENPHVGFIGGEPYINGVAKLLALIKAGNLSNIRIIDDDIRPRIDSWETKPYHALSCCFPIRGPSYVTANAAL